MTEKKHISELYPDLLHIKKEEEEGPLCNSAVSVATKYAKKKEDATCHSCVRRAKR